MYSNNKNIIYSIIMSSKEQLIDNIKKWVKLDNEIKELKSQENLRKKQQKELSDKLITTMKENDIDVFNIKQGQICYKQTKVKKPITKKVLMNILTKYYNNDLSKANNLNDYILNNREETTKETLVHKSNKE